MTAEVSSGLRSTFTWERICASPPVIAVIDLDDGTLQFMPCSVTNDAENVIRYLTKVASLTDEDRVIYRDSSQKRWDELLHRGGKFEAFAAIGLSTPEDCVTAIQKGIV